ncbi:unnamed protein product, partial [Prorocentrum cordatum]
MLQAALRRGALVRAGVAARLLPPGAAGWARREWAEALAALPAGARCALLHGDVLSCASVPGECQVVAGNIPYRISTAIVCRLLLQVPPLRRIVLLVQAEFARRLLAAPGSMKYGRVSALAACLCGSRRLVEGAVPAQLFSGPAPKVDSAVVSLEPLPGGCRSEGGSAVHPAVLERLLRGLLDGARGPARGLGAEEMLAQSEEPLGLPGGWRSAVAASGVGAAPVISLAPEQLAGLAARLQSLGWSAQGPGAPVR